MAAIALLMPLHVWAQVGNEAAASDAAEQESGDAPTIYVNGELLQLEDPAIEINGRILVPIRHLTEALEGTVQWTPETGEAIIYSSLGDEIIFQPDHPVMRYNGKEYRMDVEPVTVDQRIYVPLRHAAQFLHAEVVWDAETQSAYLTLMEPHVLQEGETVKSVSEQLGIESDMLVERNQLEHMEAMTGFPLKIVIPDIMADKIEEPVVQPTVAEPAPEAVEEFPYSDEELLLLAKITMVEAGYESYDGQLAVANVILNRVEDPRFPDSIREVIYAPNQFPPAHNGLLDRAEPNESVWKAVKAAASGENNVEGAVYFHNPDVTSGGFWSTLTEVAEIGNHRFLK